MANQLTVHVFKVKDLVEYLQFAATMEEKKAAIAQCLDKVEELGSEIYDLEKKITELSKDFTTLPLKLFQTRRAQLEAALDNYLGATRDWTTILKIEGGPDLRSLKNNVDCAQSLIPSITEMTENLKLEKPPQYHDLQNFEQKIMRKQSLVPYKDRVHYTGLVSTFHNPWTTCGKYLKPHHPAYCEGTCEVDPETDDEWYDSDTTDDDDVSLLSLLTDKEKDVISSVVKYHYGEVKFREDAPLKDGKTPVSLLQELMQKLERPIPTYIHLSSEGPSHAQVHTIQCSVLHIVTQGSAKHKKEAKHKAAWEAWKLLCGLDRLTFTPRQEQSNADANVTPLTVESNVVSGLGSAGYAAGLANALGMVGIMDQPAKFQLDSSTVSIDGQQNSSSVAMKVETDSVLPQGDSIGLEDWDGNMLDYFRKWGRIAIRQWNSGQAVGTLLGSWCVCPTQAVESTGGVVKTELTPIGVAPLLSELWRGSIEFKVEVIATKFHQGQLFCVFLPYEFGDNVPFVEALTADGVTIEMAKENELVTNCEYVAPSDYLPHTGTTGRFNVYVQTPLSVGPNNYGQVVDVNIEVRAGPDFRMYVPKMIDEQNQYHQVSEPGGAGQYDERWWISTVEANSMIDKTGFWLDEPNYVVEQSADIVTTVIPEDNGEPRVEQSASADSIKQATAPIEEVATHTYGHPANTTKFVSVSHKVKAVDSESNLLGPYMIEHAIPQDVEMPVGTLLKEIQLPQALLKSEWAPAGMAKYYRTLRCNWKFTVKVATTPMHMGCVMMVFVPVDYDAQNRSFNSMDCLFNVKLNLQGQTEATLEIPWIHFMRAYVTDTVTGEMPAGRLQIYVWNQLRTAGTQRVQYSLYASAVDGHWSAKSVQRTIPSYRQEQAGDEEPPTATARVGDPAPRPVKELGHDPRKVAYLAGTDHMNLYNLLKIQQCEAYFEIPEGNKIYFDIPRAPMKFHQYCTSLFAFYTGQLRKHFRVLAGRTQPVLLWVQQMRSNAQIRTISPHWITAAPPGRGLVDQFSPNDGATHTVHFPYYEDTNLRSTNPFSKWWIRVGGTKLEPTAGGVTYPAHAYMWGSVGEDFRLYYMLPPPHVYDDRTLILQSGDVETNPGPSVHSSLRQEIFPSCGEERVEQNKNDASWVEWSTQALFTVLKGAKDFLFATLRGEHTIDGAIRAGLDKFQHHIGMGPIPSIVTQPIMDKIIEWVKFLIRLVLGLLTFSTIVHKVIAFLRGGRSFTETLFDILAYSHVFAQSVGDSLNGWIDWLKTKFETRVEQENSITDLLSQGATTFFSFLASPFSLVLSDDSAKILKQSVVRSLAGVAVRDTYEQVKIATKKIVSFFFTGMEDEDVEFHENWWKKEGSGVLDILAEWRKRHSVNAFDQGSVRDKFAESTSAKFKHIPNDTFLTIARNCAIEMESHMPFAKRYSSHAVRFIREVTETYKKYARGFAYDANKPEPVGVWMGSSSGAGKSLFLSKLLPKAILLKLGVTSLNDQVYIAPLDPRQRYCDGYRGQLFFMLDEAGADTEQYDFASLLNWISTAKVTLNMADLEDKGVLLTSPFIFCASNMLTFTAVTAITNPDALPRRFPFTLYLQPRPEYQHNGKLDYVRMNTFLKSELQDNPGVDRYVSALDKVFHLQRLNMNTGQPAGDYSVKKFVDDIVAEHERRKRCDHELNEVLQSLRIEQGLVTDAFNKIFTQKKAQYYICNSEYHMTNIWKACFDDLNPLDNKDHSGCHSTNFHKASQDLLKNNIPRKEFSAQAKDIWNNLALPNTHSLQRKLRGLTKNTPEYHLQIYLELLASNYSVKIPDSSDPHCIWCQYPGGQIVDVPVPHPDLDPKVVQWASDTLNGWPSVPSFLSTIWKGVGFYALWIRRNARLGLFLFIMTHVGLIYLVAKLATFLAGIVQWIISFFNVPQASYSDHTVPRQKPPARLGNVHQSAGQDAKYIANTRKFYKDGHHIGYAFFLDAYNFIVPYHFVRDISFGNVVAVQAKPDSDELIKLNHFGRWQRLRHLGNETDAVVFRCLQPIPRCRKITHQFVTVRQLGQLLESSFTAHMLAPERTVPLNAVGGIYTDARTRQVYIEWKAQRITEVGDCGLPYIMDAQGPNRIFGVHSSMNTVTGRPGGAIITAESLQVAMDTLSQQFGEFPHIDVVYPKGEGDYYPEEQWAHPDFEQVGTVTMNGYVVENHIVNKPCKQPSPLGMFTKDYVPAPASLKLLIKNAQKYGGFGPEKIEPDAVLWHRAMLLVSQPYPQHTLKTLTEEQLLCGLEGLPPIVRKTSTGYWKVVADCKGFFFTDSDEETQWNENYSTVKHPWLNKTLKDHLYEYETCLRNGLVVCYPWFSTLKDEMIKKEKLQRGKVRVYEIPGMETYISIRRYLGAFAGWVRSRPGFKLGSAIGVNREEAWGVFAEELSVEGKDTWGFDVDFSEWDGSYPNVISHSLQHLVDRCYGKTDRVARAACFASLRNSWHVIGNKCAIAYRGNKSGQPLTDVYNGCGNVIALALVYVTLFIAKYGEFPTLQDWRRIRFLTWGDDLIVTAPREILKWFNRKTTFPIYRALGFYPKNAAKTEEYTESDPLIELTFLKSGFIPIRNEAIWLSPLPLDVIRREVSWIKKGTLRDPQEWWYIIWNATRQMAHHGKTQYVNFVGQMNKALDNPRMHGTFSGLRTPFPAWESIMNELAMLQHGEIRNDPWILVG